MQLRTIIAYIQFPSVHHFETSPLSACVGVEKKIWLSAATLTRTRTFRWQRYRAIALPSFEVAPVKNTSLTPWGISWRITAAVKVFPWTTRTLRLGCLSTKRVPPPFKASFWTKHTLTKNCQKNIHGSTKSGIISLFKSIFREETVIQIINSMTLLRVRELDQFYQLGRGFRVRLTKRKEKTAFLCWASWRFGRPVEEWSLANTGS